MKLKNNKKGFTLVELVIVIAVIAILAAVLIPTFATVIANANKSALQSEANNLYTGIMVEYADDVDGFDAFFATIEDKDKNEDGSIKHTVIIGEDAISTYISDDTKMTIEGTTITLTAGQYYVTITKAGVAKKVEKSGN